MAPGKLMQAMYNLSVIAYTPLVGVMMTYKRLIGKETKDTVAQRWGFATVPRPSGPLVWLSVQGVGEAAIALPILQRLLQMHPGVHVLVTADSRDGLRLLSRAVGHDKVLLQLAPFDAPLAVGRFLDHWGPTAGALVYLSDAGTTPMMLQECKWRGVPMAMLNVHVGSALLLQWTSRSHAAGSWLQDLLGCFRLIVPQTDTDTARLLLLGGEMSSMPVLSAELKSASAIAVNLVGWKLQRPPEVAVAALLAGMCNRPHWLATNTTDGEESVAASVHLALSHHQQQQQQQQAQQQEGQQGQGAYLTPLVPPPPPPDVAAVRGLLTIIAPRHLWRCHSVALQLQALGLRVVKWSQVAAATMTAGSAAGATTSGGGARPAAAAAASPPSSPLAPGAADVLLIDMPGQLALLYAATPIVFVGNSMFEGSRGTSLADVAVCGCTLLAGPHLGQYQGMADELNLAALEEARDLEDMLDVVDGHIFVDATGREVPVHAPPPRPRPTAPVPLSPPSSFAPAGEDSATPLAPAELERTFTPFATAVPPDMRAVPSGLIPRAASSPWPPPSASSSGHVAAQPNASLQFAPAPGSGSSLGESWACSGSFGDQLGELPGSRMYGHGSVPEQGSATAWGQALPPRAPAQGRAQRPGATCSNGPPAPYQSASAGGSDVTGGLGPGPGPASSAPQARSSPSRVRSFSTPSPASVLNQTQAADRRMSMSLMHPNSYGSAAASESESLRRRKGGSSRMLAALEGMLHAQHQLLQQEGQQGGGGSSGGGGVSSGGGASSSTGGVGGKSSTGPHLRDTGFNYQEPLWAPPSRFCGERITLATVLPGPEESAAVWQVDDAAMLAAVVRRMLTQRLECTSRGYAASTAAQRMARGLVSTLLALFSVVVLQPALQSDPSAQGQQQEQQREGQAQT